MKKDYKNAISVFEHSTQIEIDKSLKDIKIKIPGQQENDSWFGQNSDNSNIDNFAFNNKNIENMLSGYAVERHNCWAEV